MSPPESSAGSSTRFRSPVNSGTRPGRPMPTRFLAAPTHGRASRSTPRLGWCLPQPGRRHSISTASTGTATISSPTACSRSTRAPASAIWHFQGIQHDIWDWDFPSAPSLVTVTRDGRAVDAVAQITKQGYVFVFDRRTGTPLFPIEYRDAPPSAGGRRASRSEAAVSGEAAAVRPARPDRSHADDSHARGACRRAGAVQDLEIGISDATLTSKGRLSSRDSTAAPSGAAPRSIRRPALLYVNSNEMPWIVKLIPNNDTSLYILEVRNLPSRRSSRHAERAIAAEPRRAIHSR